MHKCPKKRMQLEDQSSGAEEATSLLSALAALAMKM